MAYVWSYRYIPLFEGAGGGIRYALDIWLVKTNKISLNSGMKPADKQNLWHYNANLKSFARENRKEMTKAEACIWKYLLSSKQMMGCQFRRQRPILNYIADFLCKELMLIIEVDGLTHQWRK